MTEWKPHICIYHSPCDDGFAAALAVKMRWDDVIMYPAAYGKPAPDVAGMRVLIVDFSFKRLVLEEMLEQAESIVILDHHKTAQEDLAPYQVELCGSARLSPEDVPGMLEDYAELGKPKCIALFDMEKSGAVLAWEFCNPDAGDVPPLLFRHVQDRDLWRFQMHDTRAVSTYLRSFPMDFEVWQGIMLRLDSALGQHDQAAILAEAAGAQRFYDRKVAELVREVRSIDVGGFDVPGVNCSWAFASDVAHALLLAYPSAPFAACYYDRGDGRRSYSLRSEDDRVDVSVIAKGLGGGGHRNAAGFEVAIP